MDETRTTVGSDGLPIGEGDVVQTRKNDCDLRVANRQTWTVQAIGDDGTVWAKEVGSGRERQHIVTLPAEYVEQHAHLSYVSTAYGVQGATVTGSHTILTDALDVAAVYVGMTRGRARNVLHIVATDLADARQQFIDAMQRDRADRGLAAATEAAKNATRGLIEDGPVKLINTELARLHREAEQAQQRAERWAQIARQLDAQTAEHKDEADDADAVLRAVEEHAAVIRAEVIEPLTVQAQADGSDYLAAVADEAEATERLHSTGRFGRRAEHERQAAHEHTEAIRGRLRSEWGAVPTSPYALTKWAAQAASARGEHDPQITEATAAVTDAHDARQAVTERQQRDRRALLAKLYGKKNVRRDPSATRSPTQPRSCTLAGHRRQGTRRSRTTPSAPTSRGRPADHRPASRSPGRTAGHDAAAVATPARATDRAGTRTRPVIQRSVSCLLDGRGGLGEASLEVTDDRAELTR